MSHTGISITEGQMSDRPVTLIRIGDATGELPRHLMTGEKTCGYIVRNETVEPWYWISVSDREGARHIVADRIDILPFSEITESLRPRALELLRALAHAFQLVPPRFINASTGFLETWRIYMLVSGGFLLLPEQLSQIILHAADEETRHACHLDYLKPDTEGPFGLCHQFTQFLYESATGFAPYARPEVREDRWQHIPLSLGFSSLDTRTADWIDRTLALAPRIQRETVSAAYSAEQNLSWFLQETASLAWDVQGEKPEFDPAQHPQLSIYAEALEKRARRRIFWRKRGALVTTVSVAILIVILSVGNLVHKSLQPPYTAGMSAPQVIEEFFVGRNSLDTQKMSASLVRSVKNPFDTEVTSLFVNSRIRKAYEGIDAVIQAGQWIDEGMQPIPESTVIYGTVDLKIEEIGQGTYRATYRSFSPADRAEESTGVLELQEWKNATEFTLTKRREHWMIERIEHTGSTLITTHMVPTYPLEPRGP